MYLIWESGIDTKDEHETFENRQRTQGNLRVGPNRIYMHSISELNTGTLVVVHSKGEKKTGDPKLIVTCKHAVNIHVFSLCLPLLLLEM